MTVQTKEAKTALNLLEQYREAIDTSLIVTITDPEGVITYVNNNFCKISGYSKEEVIDHSHNIIRHPNTNPKYYKKLWETIKNKKNGEVLYAIKKKMAVVTMLVSISSLSLMLRGISSTICLFRRISHQR